MGQGGKVANCFSHALASWWLGEEDLIKGVAEPGGQLEVAWWYGDPCSGEVICSALEGSSANEGIAMIGVPAVRAPRVVPAARVADDCPDCG